MNIKTIIFLMSISSVAFSGELIYEPVNPSFGGSPLNASTLMESANAQNKFKEPDSQDSSLTDFNESLQRALLNRLTNALSDSFVDANGKLVPGLTETDDFIISITSVGGGNINVTTTDKLTGTTTSFTVSQ